jgi:hypothetical protein
MCVKVINNTKSTKKSQKPVRSLYKQKKKAGGRYPKIHKLIEKNRNKKRIEGREKLKKLDEKLWKMYNTHYHSLSVCCWKEMVIKYNYPPMWDLVCNRPTCHECMTCFESSTFHNTNCPKCKNFKECWFSCSYNWNYTWWIDPRMHSRCFMRRPGEVTCNHCPLVPRKHEYMTDGKINICSTCNHYICDAKESDAIFISRFK